MKKFWEGFLWEQEYTASGMLWVIIYCWISFTRKDSILWVSIQMALLIAIIFKVFYGIGKYYNRKN